MVKGSQSPLKFNHIGYSVSYTVSHDTLIVSQSTSMCVCTCAVGHVLPEDCTFGYKICSSGACGLGNLIVSAEIL